MVVSVKDLEILEDQIDFDDARKALADIKKNGTVSWKVVKCQFSRYKNLTQSRKRR